MLKCNKDMSLPDATGRPWLGLEHINKTPKRTRVNYLEKAIKIYNWATTCAPALPCSRPAPYIHIHTDSHRPIHTHTNPCTLMQTHRHSHKLIHTHKYILCDTNAAFNYQTHDYTACDHLRLCSHWSPTCARV